MKFTPAAATSTATSPDPGGAAGRSTSLEHLGPAVAGDDNSTHVTIFAMADALRDTARHFRRQAADCRNLGSPLYAGLLEHIATDIDAGGVSSTLLADHRSDRGTGLLPLRLLGGVHALVLARQAPALALYYPSVGGTADPGVGADRAWPALRDVLAGQADALRLWLDRAPQTNEVGRGAALVGAMCRLVSLDDRPIRLVEVGASAGLNLRADMFHITGAGSSYGDPGSPVQLLAAWRGARPPEVPLRVVDDGSRRTVTRCLDVAVALDIPAVPGSREQGRLERGDRGGRGRGNAGCPVRTRLPRTRVGRRRQLRRRRPHHLAGRAPTPARHGRRPRHSHDLGQSRSL